MLWCAHRPYRAEARGTLERRLPDRLCAGADHRRVLPRARRPDRLSRRRDHHGPAAVAADAGVRHLPRGRAAAARRGGAGELARGPAAAADPSSTARSRSPATWPWHWPIRPAATTRRAIHRRRRRLRHRARGQPAVRRADRAGAGAALARARQPGARGAGRARARARHADGGLPARGAGGARASRPPRRSIWSRPARSCASGRPRHCRACRSIWHDELDGLPEDRPLLLVANEFLDALPVRQFMRRGGRWHERLVDVDEQGHFGFVVARHATPFPEAVGGVVGDAPEGTLLELGPARRGAGRGHRPANGWQQGGVALLIDYGSDARPCWPTPSGRPPPRGGGPPAGTWRGGPVRACRFRRGIAGCRATGAQVYGPLPQGRSISSGLGAGSAPRAPAA